MTFYEPPAEMSELSLAFHFLGQISFDDALALQLRLVQEAASSPAPRARLLFCEHPALITIGRIGSRGHVRLSGERLRHERLAVRWVSRGGGCVLHAPGQLAVYPIVPLAGLGWSIGQYLERLQRGLLDALRQLQVHPQTQPGHFAVWGRSGLLAAVGVAVREGVTCHGAFLNVNPAMRPFAFVDSLPTEVVAPGTKTTMGCLLAERRTAVRMSSVRAALVDGLARAFGTERYHLHTGHPWLVRSSGVLREAAVGDD
jgi:lipoyl(octanoyl) transferase